MPPGRVAELFTEPIDGKRGLPCDGSKWQAFVLRGSFVLIGGMRCLVRDCRVMFSVIPILCSVSSVFRHNVILK